MNSINRIILAVTGAVALAAAPVRAQDAMTSLTIHVESVPGDVLTGQPVELTHTDYQVGYGSLKLNSAGECKLSVYAGNHELKVERPGFETLTHDFVVDEDGPMTVNVTLTEKTKQPYALTAATDHDIFTGQDDVTVSWNVEPPVFFDDFESYEPFALNFGQWTGIDGDREIAAPLLGAYPNRGTLQYAQIINPLTVTPTWWYDYPVLRPYSGQQYVGFTRTNTGKANDDWLISPTITPGTDNILSFMGKAADQYNERFMVYVTDKTDNPGADDFKRLDSGNYEMADYKGWKEYRYDLSEYAGREIKFAIRYISDTNRYGAFMLMIDDVYVGQPIASASSQANVRAHRSPANPNEKFNIYLDGNRIGQTAEYTYLIENVAAGEHVIGIEAEYRAEKSAVSELHHTTGMNNYAKVSISASSNSVLPADNVQLTLLCLDNAQSWPLTVNDGVAEIPSLPYGKYRLHLDAGAFEAIDKDMDVAGDAVVEIALHDNACTPYNLTADLQPDGRTLLRWNRDLGFRDSFEDYDDFATEQFGEWRAIDNDKLPVYPIALGGQQNIVSFPGSGTASNPTAIGPMVFNPWNTNPPMLPTDPAIAAPDGDKSIIFFSPQRAKADKILISPAVTVRPGYMVHFLAKGYSSAYPESMQVLVAENFVDEMDFKIIGEIDELTSATWSLYSVPLTGYEGKEVRIALRYTSYDAFLAQVDSFAVCGEEGETTGVDYGNVLKYEVTVDGNPVGESEKTEFYLSNLADGKHVAGVTAIYKETRSQTAEIEFNSQSGVISVTSEEGENVRYFDLQGRKLPGQTQGVNVICKDNKSLKILK